MRENIFFNREQLKIIRWYGILYHVFFKYWILLFAGILSLVGAIFIFSSSYFSSLYLLEKNAPIRVSPTQDDFYQKQRTALSLSGVQSLLLNGSLTVGSGIISSENNLMALSGLTLPRLANLSYSDFSSFALLGKQKHFTDEELNKFFSLFLFAPLEKASWRTTPPFLPVKDSLTEHFGLQCIYGSTAHSFVCKSYIHDFLKYFFLYDLGDNASAQKAENEVGTPEILEIYAAIKNNGNYREDFCRGMVRYGLYGGALDDRFLEIFRDCKSDLYSQFLLLRDFFSLNKSLALGYADAKMYSDALVNQYKLFSLQQLLYKQLSATADVKTLMQSYLGFLRAVLIREGNRNIELLSPFSKTFAYWYNMNILVPYLKDEKSKMSKEDKTSLMNQLLTLNYNDKVSHFVGLQEQSLYQYETTTVENTSEKTLDIEKLFRSSYLPDNFTLISAVPSENNSTLLIQGIDRKSWFSLTATLKYENIELFVSDIQLKNKEKLTSYLNALIAGERYSLNKVLSLMKENEQIAEEEEKPDLNLCAQLKEKYEKRLLTCSSTEIKISQAWSVGTGNIVYTFWLKNASLQQVKISDKLLETKVLKALDSSLWDATTAFYMINNIIAYVPQEESSGFGMKEHLLVSEKFSKYLGIAPDEVYSEGGSVKVNFKVDWISFIGTYNLSKSELKPIALDFWATRRPIIVQGLAFSLKDEQLEEISIFMFNPLEYLKKLNPALVKRYFPEK